MHADALFLREIFDHGQAVGHQFGQGHAFRNHMEVARLDRRQIQHIVDQPQQVPAGLHDMADTRRVPL